MNDRDNPLASNYVRLADGQFAKIESELRKKLERVRNVSHMDRKSLVLDSTAAHEIQSLAEEDIGVEIGQGVGRENAQVPKRERSGPPTPC